MARLPRFVPLAVLAASCATTITKQAHETAKIHHDIGIEEMKKGNTRGALRELLIAVDNDPTIPEVHNALGLAYHQLHKTEEALGHYEQAVTLKKDYSEAHNNMGTLLIDMGRYDEAVQHFDAALADILFPRPHLAEGNKGWALYKKGDVERGVQHLENAVATTPGFCRGYEWLARIGLDIESTEQVGRACERFEKYCIEDEANAKNVPGFYRAEVRYYCGLGQLKAGNRDEARDIFAKCADTSGSDSGFAAKCADSLQNLQ